MLEAGDLEKVNTALNDMWITKIHFDGDATWSFDSETLLPPSGTYLADLWGMKEELVAFIKIALSGRTPKIDDHGLKASTYLLSGWRNLSGLSATMR